jgi:hypothetical protein
MRARPGGARSRAALPHDDSGAAGIWTPYALPPGQARRRPAPLVIKLDESAIEEEYARLEA